MDDDYMDCAAIAAELGVAVDTVRTYHKRAVANRRKAEREGDPSAVKPGDLPPPDLVVGRTPAWRRTTVDVWKQDRPGQGAGGGRPW